MLDNRPAQHRGDHRLGGVAVVARHALEAALGSCRLPHDARRQQQRQQQRRDPSRHSRCWGGLSTFSWTSSSCVGVAGRRTGDVHELIRPVPLYMILVFAMIDGARFGWLGPLNVTIFLEQTCIRVRDVNRT